MLILGIGAAELMLYGLPMAGAILLIYGVFQAVVESRDRDKAKIMSRLQERSQGGSSNDRQKKIRDSLLRRQAMEETNPFFQFISDMSIVPKIQGMLDQANIEMVASRFLTALSATAVGVLALLAAVGVNVFAAFGVGMSFLFLPLLWLRWKRNRRMTKMVTQLPDVFELMSQALRAGHSLAGAFETVAEQLPDPCGTEFGRAFQEQNLGLRIEDALLNLSKRCDQMDIRFFVTAVMIQRQTGGDLAEVLDKISGIIRGRIELFGQVKGLTAEGRMSGWVLLALPVVVYMASLFMNREYAMTLIVETKGRMMLCMAGMMQLMGMAMIKKIVSIKV